MRGRFLEIVAADPHVHPIATGDASAVPGLVEHRAGILDQIASLIVELAPEVLGDEIPMRTHYGVGRCSWSAAPTSSSRRGSAIRTRRLPKLAAIAAGLCIAVVDGMATR